MLRQRLLFGTLMIVAVVGIVILDAWVSQTNPQSNNSCAMNTPSCEVAHSWGSGLPIVLFILAMTVLANYEMAGVLRHAGFQPAAHWAALVVAGLVATPWIEMQQYLGNWAACPLTALNQAVSPTLVWLAGGVIGACLAIMFRKQTQGAIGNLATTLLLMLYLGLLGSIITRLRCEWPGVAGSALVVYFLLTVKASDIGAYLTGMAVGRHKLIPWLSPGKTIEGAIGAIVFSALVSLGLMTLWGQWQNLGTPPFSGIQALVFGFVMAVAGHLGDLVESLMKRDAAMKDSGAIIPAFGGLLDLMDSPLVAGVFAYVFFHACQRSGWYN